MPSCLAIIENLCLIASVANGHANIMFNPDDGTRFAVETADYRLSVNRTDFIPMLDWTKFNELCRDGLCIRYLKRCTEKSGLSECAYVYGGPTDEYAVKMVEKTPGAAARVEPFIGILNGAFSSRLPDVFLLSEFSKTLEGDFPLCKSQSRYEDCFP